MSWQCGPLQESDLRRGRKHLELLGVAEEKFQPAQVIVVERVVNVRGKVIAQQVFLQLKSRRPGRSDFGNVLQPVVTRLLKRPRKIDSRRHFLKSRFAHRPKRKNKWIPRPVMPLLGEVVDITPVRGDL